MGVGGLVGLDWVLGLWVWQIGGVERWMERDGGRVEREMRKKRGE
jgi:hypothetical protein